MASQHIASDIAVSLERHRLRFSEASLKQLGASLATSLNIARNRFVATSLSDVLHFAF